MKTPMHSMSAAVASPTAPDCEFLSALVDSELTDAEFEQAVPSLLDADDAVSESWYSYHLIGDVLRSGSHAPLGVRCNASGFAEKVVQELAAEHARLAPVAQAVVPGHARAAANDSWMWKSVAACASVVAVATLSWTWWGAGHNAANGAQVAQLNTAAPALSASSMQLPGKDGQMVAVGQEGAMIRDPRLDALLAAHKQFGGSSALQAPAGFLRDATFVVPNR